MFAKTLGISEVQAICRACRQEIATPTTREPNVGSSMEERKEKSVLRSWMLRDKSL